jgi:hypothetical protein
VVRAEMSRDAVPVDRCIEHAAYIDARDRTAVHAEPDETARELAHHHEHPRPTRCQRINRPRHDSLILRTKRSANAFRMKRRRPRSVA